MAIAEPARTSIIQPARAQQVTPSADYEYDALYRLVKAPGREHAGGVGDDLRDHNDLPLWNLPHPNNTRALRNYVEQYSEAAPSGRRVLLRGQAEAFWRSVVSTFFASASMTGSTQHAPGADGAFTPAAPQTRRVSCRLSIREAVS